MVIGVTGPRAHKIHIGYHDGNNIFVQWRLRRLCKSYLNYYDPEVVFTGMATGFDTSIAEACVDLGIPFYAIVPFEGQEQRWNEEQKKNYYHLIEQAEEKIVVSDGPPTAKKYQIRNQYIVDNSELLLALWDRGSKGTSNCVKYAKQTNTTITDLFPIWEKRKYYKFPFSNFQSVNIETEEGTFPSVENYFQAMKTFDEDKRQRFTAMSPKEARDVGKSLSIRNDWEEVKNDIMMHALRKKFETPRFNMQLKQTGNDELIEWNLWHDNEWGVCYCNKCRGKGKNKLGKMLMELREEMTN